MLGTLQRPFLQERIARLERAAGGMKTWQAWQHRAERFGDLLLEAAPAWCDEALAMASAAGLEGWHVLLLNDLPPELWAHSFVPPDIAAASITDSVNPFEAQGYEPLLGGDCTSLLALPDATLTGSTLLHKNRDQRDEIQWAGIRQVEKAFRCAGGGEIGGVGLAHLLTENGWAAANHTGSPVPPAEYRDGALRDTHVLRWLGERCATLDEIPAAIELLVARGWLGGAGWHKGMIFLLADDQRGLWVEATAQRVAWQWLEAASMVVCTNHFLLPETAAIALPPTPGSLARFERATALWGEREGLATMADCAEIARDRQGAPFSLSLLPEDGAELVTVSSSTCSVEAAADRCVMHLCNGHPSYTPVEILVPLDRVSDSDLVSGRHAAYWRSRRGNCQA